MANAFPMSGNIDPLTFPHLLVDLHRQGATGSLKITGAHHPKALYFRGGRVLFGSSNDPRDQLGSILIEDGKITREQLDDVNSKVGPGSPLAKVLADSGFVNQRELGEAARVKVERILADVLSWDAGAFEFEDGVLPKGAVDLKLSTEKLLFAAVQRIPDRSFALRHVELRTVLEPTPDADTALSEIRAEVWPLFERLDGARTLKDAIALTRLDEFEAAKTACAMLFLGIIQKQEAEGGGEVDLAEEAQSGLGAAADQAFFTMPAQPATPKPPPFTPTSPPAPAEPEPFVLPEAPPPPPQESPFFAAPSDESPEPSAEPEPEPEIAVAAGPAATPPTLVGMEMPSPRPEPAAEPSPQPPSVPSFNTSAPVPRISFDTQPGDRPAYPAPPLVPPPSRSGAYAPVARTTSPSSSGAFSVPDIPTPATQPRASRQDLASLDELLSNASAKARVPSGLGRPAGGRPSGARPSASAVRRVARTPPSGSSSSWGMLVAGLFVAIAVTAGGAWYFLLRTPGGATSPTTTIGRRLPTAAPTATPVAPAPPASPSPASAPAIRPTNSPATTVTLAPASTPAPRPTPATPRTPAPAGAGPAADPATLLRQGALPEAARGFVATVGARRNRFSLQLLTACAPETVQKAVAAGGSDVLILPVKVSGRACYRICWGVYDTRQAAESASSSVPAYFRQGGAKPRVSPLAELLP